MTSATPTVSIIIPTLNRKVYLRETLFALEQQTWPADRFEVIIVDDGSTDGTGEIATLSFPFVLRYIWQSNQGDAAARNTGARLSQADILVFLDDDIIVDCDYLRNLLEAHKLSPKSIVVGTEFLWLGNEKSKTPAINMRPSAEDHRSTIEITFTEVVSNNMSLEREAFFSIGKMEGLDFPGSSMWCDVDFAYRAYRKGFNFIRSTKALCWHRDHTKANLVSHKNRMKIASFRSVALFQKFPELISYLPMFSDKTPISWKQDPPSLIGRKLARRIISNSMSLWTMEQFVNTIDKFYPSSNLVSSFSRLIIGGYIFQGYRKGLRAFGMQKKT